MKTCCKNVDILDLDFITASVMECFEGKWSRDDVASIISKYSDYTKSQVKELVRNDRKHELYYAVDNIAKEIQWNISNHTIELPSIKYSERYDVNSKKFRIIGTQSLIHQCYEYVAVNACMELFDKKFGVYQCASIPNRGQSYGKKAIEKWLKNDIPGTRYAVKMDVKKCYPSIDQCKIKNLLHRDLHKNPTLLYLLDFLISMYDNGLSIGSHLSQWLCNYYLSYAYHFISEKLFITRKSKRTGKIENVRLISHVIFYMDDVIIFSGNKKHLMKATHLVNGYFLKELSLTIKPNWRMFKVQYVDKNNKIHGSFVDMMGFRFYRGKTAIRQSVFKKMKRKFHKIHKRMKKYISISKRMAQSIMSYWGWIKNTNSFKFSQQHQVNYVINKARKIVSYYASLDAAEKKKVKNQKRTIRKKRRKIKNGEIL